MGPCSEPPLNLTKITGMIPWLERFDLKMGKVPRCSWKYNTGNIWLTGFIYIYTYICMSYIYIYVNHLLTIWDAHSIGPSFPRCWIGWYTDDWLSHWGMMIPHGKARKNNEYFMRWDRRIYIYIHIHIYIYIQWLTCQCWVYQSGYIPPGYD